MEEKRVYLEEAQKLEVFDNADVLVVGAGAAGHSAAVAAARAGAQNVVVLERYGYMGGLVTGGYVLLLPALSWYGQSYVRGLQEEWNTRLEPFHNGVYGPTLEEAGSTDPTLLAKFRWVTSAVSPLSEVPKRIVRTTVVDPQLLKIVMDNMVEEQKDRIRLYLHSWATKPIMDGDTCRGVVFESKEGRKAIFAKVVIDATGDGDIFYQAGAPCMESCKPNARAAKMALVWRCGGVDYKKFTEWRGANSEAYNQEVLEASWNICGFRQVPCASTTNDVVWFNNWIANRTCIDVKDLTATELDVRRTIPALLDHYRENVPGFENAYLIDIAPQQGTRCGRRLNGEYVMTAADYAYERHFDDVIAWHSTLCQINDSAPIEIPYRCILPKKIENLLAPGRHLSADEQAIDWLNLIPQCVGTGQAAGVAAAVCAMDGTTTHTVDIKKVQKILTEQDVPLPRQENTDPAKMQNVIDHQAGLYTKVARRIHAGELKPSEFALPDLANRATKQVNVCH